MLFTARPNWSELDSPARLGVLTPALRSHALDATLQQLVADAGKCTGYPLALVTLVLERTTLRRAHHGLPPDLALAQETDRKHSLCQFVVAGGQEVEVYDAQAEPQLPQEALRRHGIRAYVGLPLRVQGQVVGSLCVVDLKPRVLLAHQRIELRTLATRAERRLAALAGGGPSMRIMVRMERPSSVCV